MNRCKRCLIPDTRPDTAFVDGVCSACITHDKQKAIDWESRKHDLQDLLNRQKPNDSGFDCIVASSGGKDSHAQVWDLLQLGVKPLIVTAATCFLTPMGRRNIDNLKRYAPTLEVTPNQDVRARLNRLGLHLVGDVSWPEHVAIFTTPLRMAVALGIPLVFYGENPQAQYGGPIGSEEANQMTRRWVSEFGGFLGLRPIDMVGQDGITARDMVEYKFPEDRDIRKLKAEAHFLGQYVGPWDSHRNAAVAMKMGMEVGLPCNCNWWPFENLDNAMTGLHDYMMLRKYGFGRGCAQISVDIRNHRITREDAMIALKAMESRFPRWYGGVGIWEVLSRMNMTEDDMWKVIDKFTVKHDEA